MNFFFQFIPSSFVLGIFFLNPAVGFCPFLFVPSLFLSNTTIFFFSILDFFSYLSLFLSSFLLLFPFTIGFFVRFYLSLYSMGIFYFAPDPFQFVPYTQRTLAGIKNAAQHLTHSPRIAFSCSSLQ